MAYFSDKELLLLSNLLYMNSDTIKDKDGDPLKNPFTFRWDGLNKKTITIRSILDSINTDNLRKYYSDCTFDGKISGAEWADMIDAMKQTDLCELTLKDVCIDDKKSLSAYFTDKGGNAYVVFKGTSAGEWQDNFDAAYESDTEQQKRALDFINSIDAKNITVVGHSKGGNKAKYVAILSDKVTRCVSFDGQGFSQYFFEKYQDRIEKCEYKITCYALDEDFVNILLYDVYIKKIYLKGYGVGEFQENHSPSSAFFYTYDKDKKIVSSIKPVDTQADYISKLHSFVNYVSSTIPNEQREDLFNYLGTVAAMNLGKQPYDYTKSYTMMQKLSFLTSEENADDLGLLLAYIVNYEEYDKGITDAIFQILKSNGFPFNLIVNNLKKLEKYINTENILKFVLERHDEAVNFLKLLNAPDEIIDFVNKASDAYYKMKDSINPVTLGNIADYDASANDYIRDYSESIREMLLNLTDEINNEKPWDISKWDVFYRIEDWFGLLNIDSYKNNIDGYFQKVIDINGISHQQLQQIFNNVDLTVKKYKYSIDEEIVRIKELSGKIRELITIDINSAS